MSVNRKLTSAVVISTIASATLMGSIYIVPTNISNYEKKTDQSFYDLYQNSNSVIANGLSSTVKKRLQYMSTSAKIVTGDTINRVGQASIAGSPVKGGTTGSFTLAGHTYTVSVDKQGNTSLQGYGSDGSSRVILKNAVTSGQHCVSGGKYGCTQLSRGAQNLYFDLATGTLTTTNVSESASRSCGKYGCSTGNWNVTSVNNITRRKIGIRSILQHKTIATTKFSFTPANAISDNAGNNGKYAS